LYRQTLTLKVRMIRERERVNERASTKMVEATTLGL
jgi:hypothetical protein